MCALQSMLFDTTIVEDALQTHVFMTKYMQCENKYVQPQRQLEQSPNRRRASIVLVASLRCHCKQFIDTHSTTKQSTQRQQFKKKFSHFNFPCINPNKPPTML
ncbi:hypothetical protein Tcan_00179 [Toxocara canis]|uniref:Uncharacterized protein n=1 Tax=Toxocara canis TaxID=6265 RepID=A0A0B2VMF6_TOXCA|nr:hypothetical protein Tcan_00179 [Toxocara canis]